MEQNFIEDNLVLLSKQTIDVFLLADNPSDVMGLFIFYYYTAKWQKTNTIKCTTKYVTNGLKWSKERTIKSKKFLQKNALIKDIKRKNKSGKIEGWYIKLNYIWKKECVKNQRVASPEGGFNHPVAKPTTNALSVNSINALNINNINALSNLAKSLDFANSKQINELLTFFRDNINPSINYANKTQRDACNWLIKHLGMPKLKELLKFVIQIQSEPYAPVVTTPYQVKEKFANIRSFYLKSKKELKGITL